MRRLISCKGIRFYFPWIACCFSTERQWLVYGLIHLASEAENGSVPLAIPTTFGSYFQYCYTRKLKFDTYATYPDLNLQPCAKFPLSHALGLG